MTTEQRPAHSPLGASGAERWMNCAGSVTLLNRLDIPEETDEPDYRSEGTTAHEGAGHCLQSGEEPWEIEGRKFGKHDFNKEMVEAATMYIKECMRDAEPEDLVLVETGIANPDIHKDFYGTVDFARVKWALKELRVRDFKYGAGIAVDAERNPQIMYYAAGILFMLLKEGKLTLDALKDWTISLGIVQPRAFHSEGPIRRWSIPALDLLAWVENDLKPAMNATALEQDLDAGKWCRFCPAKLVCPLMESLFGHAMTADPRKVVELTSASLGRSYQYTEAVKFYLKALQEETFRRLNAGQDVPGTKLVNKKGNRVWKDGAETVLRMKYGSEAYTKPGLLSPAQIDEMDGGKAQTAQWAMSPQTGLTVALASDKKPGVKVKTAAETFAGVVSSAASASENGD